MLNAFLDLKECFFFFSFGWSHKSAVFNCRAATLQWVGPQMSIQHSVISRSRDRTWEGSASLETRAGVWADSTRGWETAAKHCCSSSVFCLRKLSLAEVCALQRLRVRSVAWTLQHLKFYLDILSALEIPALN